MDPRANARDSKLNITLQEACDSFESQQLPILAFARLTLKHITGLLNEKYNKELKPDHKASTLDWNKELHNEKVLIGRSLFELCKHPIESFEDVVYIIIRFEQLEKQHYECGNNKHIGKLGEIFMESKQIIASIKTILLNAIRQYLVLNYDYAIKYLQHLISEEQESAVPSNTTSVHHIKQREMLSNLLISSLASNTTFLRTFEQIHKLLGLTSIHSLDQETIKRFSKLHEIKVVDQDALEYISEEAFNTTQIALTIAESLELYFQIDESKIKQLLDEITKSLVDSEIVSRTPPTKVDLLKQQQMELIKRRVYFDTLFTILTANQLAPTSSLREYLTRRELMREFVEDLYLAEKQLLWEHLQTSKGTSTKYSVPESAMSAYWLDFSYKEIPHSLRRKESPSTEPLEQKSTSRHKKKDISKMTVSEIEKLSEKEIEDLFGESTGIPTDSNVNEPTIKANEFESFLINYTNAVMTEDDTKDPLFNKLISNELSQLEFESNLEEFIKAFVELRKEILEKLTDENVHPGKRYGYKYKTFNQWRVIVDGIFEKYLSRLNLIHFAKPFANVMADAYQFMSQLGLIKTDIANQIENLKLQLQTLSQHSTPLPNLLQDYLDQTLQRLKIDELHSLALTQTKQESLVQTGKTSSVYTTSHVLYRNSTTNTYEENSKTSLHSFTKSV